MKEHFIILPLLMHLATAITMIFLWRKVAAQRIISVISSTLILIVSGLLFAETWNTGIITMQSGNWQAPFGITFVSDVFSSTMVLFTSISCFAVSIYSTIVITKARMKAGVYSICHVLFMAIITAFIIVYNLNLF